MKISILILLLFGFVCTSIAGNSIDSIYVSSQLKDKNRPADFYKPENMIDGKLETAWSEGDSGNGIGESIEFHLDGPKTITAMKIITGYAKSDKLFKANNRIKEIKISFSSHFSQVATLADTQQYQRVGFNIGPPTTMVRLTILDIYKGSAYNDACISEIEFEYLPDKKSAAASNNTTCDCAKAQQRINAKKAARIAADVAVILAAYEHHLLQDIQEYGEVGSIDQINFTCPSQTDWVIFNEEAPGRLSACSKVPLGTCGTCTKWTVEYIPGTFEFKHSVSDDCAKNLIPKFGN